MSMDDARELFQRHPANPILKASDFPKMMNAAFNPGAVMFEGETLLLVRVEDRRGLSRFHVACSEDGVTGWKVDMGRCLVPERQRYEEYWGIEDPRITCIDGTYYVVYTGFSRGGPLVCLASTKDFVTFDRHGVLRPPEDKDGALFPTRFGNLWALLHRPAPVTAGLGANVWLSFSPDLRYWGDEMVLLHARRGGWWDANKIGLGPPPMLTARGWLLCYHGVRTTAAGSLYRLGLALLKTDDPRVVLARGDEWVFGPAAPYETAGDVPDVVFPCGWILDEDGTIRMYYGAADSTVCLATARVDDLLGYLQTHPHTPEDGY